MKNLTFLSLVLLTPLLAIACGETVTTSDEPDPDSGDALGDEVCFCSIDVGEELTGYAEDGEPAPTCICEVGNQETLGMVVSCGAAGSCGDVSIQRIEGGEDYNLNGDAACLIEALRSKTPGTYELSSTDTFSNGQLEIRHTFAMAADGALTRTSIKNSYGVFDVQDEVVTIYGPAESCETAADSAFDACLDAIDEGPEAAAGCLFDDALESLFTECSELASDECAS